MDDIFGFVQIRDLKVVKGLNFINENRTHYFSEELKFIKSLGISFSIVKSYQFNYSYKILNKFSNSFYRNKQENVNFPETLSKVILNSTYGKLGVNQNLDLTPITQNTQNMYTPNFLRNVPNHNQPIENNLTSVALASSISAYSRITMSQYLFSKDMKINYVNTDSLISGSSIKKFPVNDILGSFKKSTPIYYDRGVYINLKSFILSNFKPRSSKIKGTMFGQEENLEYLLYSTYQNFYEPRWYSEQTNIFTQTRKIRFGLTFNPKAIRRK